MKFSEHLKYLSESIDVEHEFSEEVYDKLKAMKFAFNGSSGFFYSDKIVGGRVVKSLVILPTDDEKEVELRIYNGKIDDDNLFLEDKTVKLKNIQKIKEVSDAMDEFADAQEKAQIKIFAVWNKSI